MKIRFSVLEREYLKYKDKYQKAAIRALDSGNYILGRQGECFEEEFSAFLNIKFCAGVNSGLDALILALRALEIGVGDEVILPANTFIATALSVTENGATPVFVEPDEFYNLDADKLEMAITPRTKAIIVVHLYGQSANMDKIAEIAKAYQLFLIEDCAQSHGAKFNGKMTGSFGHIGCFSFYPTKNLGAFGDGGAIVTEHLELIELIKLLRNYGSKIKYQNEVTGVNSRLDELQAALLSVKLSHYKEIVEERINLSKRYTEGIKNNHFVKPEIRSNAEHVWHQYVIRCQERNRLQEYLHENEIETQIHYPIPPHLAKCYKNLGYKEGSYPVTEKYANQVLSLPLYTGMTIQEQDYVIDRLNKFK